MKKPLGLIFLLPILLFAKASFGSYSDEFMLGRASFTASNEGPIKIPASLPGDVLWAVISSSNVATGSVTLYDSSGTAQNKIGVIYLGSSNGAFSIPFEVRLSSGLTYTTAGNLSGVTIVWKKLLPY